ncbi:type II toxin-antitoxin system Phd/YefM family antitoxin [Sphingomonas abaci]|uniref:Antitoxin n=1 Tax=Sphingomonas abaci TaxID=237611 RepID=A0A7W7AHI1_9SPHN|nr:type II toxin-antitoxin system Phd/YefM family antitoxin [Sphingomonas abaci]MBB4617107.1 hypothetical protein [Sphingomonas abaci]
MKMLSSRAFNQDVSLAKRLARLEPVFITDRGRPTHVLIGIEAFRQMAGQGDSIVDLLAAEGEALSEPPPAARWMRGGSRTR